MVLGKKYICSGGNGCKVACVNKVVHKLDTACFYPCRNHKKRIVCRKATKEEEIISNY